MNALIARKHLRPPAGDPPEADPGEILSLLHFDGTNNSTSFPDETGRVWTRTGTGIVISTAQSPGHGTSSLKSVAGAARSDLRTASSDFLLGSGASQANVEFDFWLRLDSVNNGGWGNYLVCWRPDIASGPQFSAGGTGANASKLYFEGSSGAVFGSTTLATATNYHVLVNLYGGLMRIFLNGVLDGSGAMTATGSPSTTDFCLAGGYYTQARLAGYMNEFRFVGNAPERTANFTPPASPYTYP